MGKKRVFLRGKVNLFYTTMELLVANFTKTAYKNACKAKSTWHFIARISLKTLFLADGFSYTVAHCPGSLQVETAGDSIDI